MPNIIRTGGGAVTPPMTYLYNLGDENTALTGGWDSNVWGAGVLTTNGIYRLTKNENSLYGKLSAFQQTYYRGTVNKINLTDYTRLKSDIVYTHVLNSFVYLYVQSVDQANPFGSYGGVNPIAKSEKTNSFTGTMELDVTALNGEYYVFMCLMNGSVSGGTNAELTISKIFLE